MSNQSHVFHRSQRANPPIAVKGDGPYLIDTNGKRYLDGSGGAAVSCLGHSDPVVIEAVKKQIEQMAFAHTGFFSSEPAEQLAELITARSQGLEKVYFVSGGSEANECALKMARQYYVEIGQPERANIISRRQSYHGNTLETLAVGGSPARRKAFEPILVQNISHLSPCHTYRGLNDGETEEAYADRLAQEFEDEIQRLGPDTVMCFIAETVGGATAGALDPVPGYFKRMREICDRHGILLILDEVMCGMGRTGTHFTYTQEGILPDIVTNAKGLGAGYQPIGSVTVSAKIHDAFADGSGAFSHGHTYIGHPTACAAALAVQTEVDRRGLLQNVQKRGDELAALLADRFADQPWCGNLRGRGLFRGIELVADKDTKAPFDPSLKVAAKIKAGAMERGLICYPGSGTIDGVKGDHVLLAPPFILETTHLEELVDKLAGAIKEAVA